MQWCEGNSQLGLVIWWIRDTELRIYQGYILPVKDAYLGIYNKKLVGYAKFFPKETGKKVNKTLQKWLCGSKMHLRKAKICHYQCPAERRVHWTIPNCDKELTTIPGLPREKLRKGYKVAWLCLACQKVGGTLQASLFSSVQKGVWAKSVVLQLCSSRPCVSVVTQRWGRWGRTSYPRARTVLTNSFTYWNSQKNSTEIKV